MNRKKRLLAILTLIKWQLASRLLNKPMLHTWIDEVKLVIRPGEHGLTQNLYCGIQDFEDMAFILHAIREDDFFVDIGANAGSYTLIACGVCGAKGAAFEPVPSTFDRLKLNCAVNALDPRVKLHPNALGEAPGEIRFSVSSDCTNHAIAEGENYEGEILSVPVKRLDDTAFESNPTFLKIDVEGFETSVISGGESILRNPDLLAIIMELNGSGNRYGYDEEQLQEKIENFGFLPYQYKPFERTLLPLGKGKKGAGNTLFIRDISKIEKRINTARIFSIQGTQL